MNKSNGNNDSAWDIGVYVLMGLPGQTVNEVTEAIEFVNKSGIKTKLAEFSPVPGTEEFQKATRLYPQIKHEPLYHNKGTFATHGMGIDYKTFDELKSMAKGSGKNNFTFFSRSDLG